MMKAALRSLSLKPEDCVIVGDRMETDILGGVQSEINTCLVLSGVMSIKDLSSYSYLPDIVLPGVGAIPGPVVTPSKK